jgi:hypothetical protein
VTLPPTWARRSLADRGKSPGGNLLAANELQQDDLPRRAASATPAVAGEEDVHQTAEDPWDAGLAVAVQIDLRLTKVASHMSHMSHIQNPNVSAAVSLSQVSSQVVTRLTAASPPVTHQDLPTATRSATMNGSFRLPGPAPK